MYKRALAPDSFTMSELSAIYTAALGYPVDPTNLRRVLERPAVQRVIANEQLSAPFV